MFVIANNLKGRSRQRGITLIEALVALFIMSIGLLGVAGLQATSIAAGHTSGQRALAVFHSQAIAEAIRANRSAGVGYNTATVTAQLNGCSDDASAATACTAAQMAAEDIFRWQSALDVAFFRMGTAGSFGSIAVNNATQPPTATINISWTERGTAMSYTTSVSM